MDELLSMSLKELSQVPVTIASRTEQSFIEAPSSVSVITKHRITQLGVRTLTDLLNYVPGFQSYMSPHESNRSLVLARGISDVYGKNILLMIDGLRINDEYTGGFTFANHLLSLYNVKQVEFIRGPGSAIYGAGAFSGVINIITEHKNEATITSGSNNTKNISALVTGSNKVIDASLAFNFYKDNGQTYNDLTDRNNFNLSTVDPVEVLEGRIDLSYKRSQLSLQFMDTQLNDYYVFNRISNNINFNDSSRFSLDIKQEFKLPQQWKGNARVATVVHKRQQQTLLSPTDTIPFGDKWQQNTSELQFDFSYLTQAHHQFSMGAYFAIMDIPVASFSDSTERFVLDNTRRVQGIYFQDQFNINTNLLLTAGLRYDNYSDIGDTLNPRLALLYNLPENDSLKFMYGRAYRAPSMGDLYDVEGIINGEPNLSIKPVIVNSYELAYQHATDNKNIILTWFFNDYSDFISTRSTQTAPIFDNTYDTQVQGLELDFQWQINSHWTANTGLTHIISRNIDVLVSGAEFSDPGSISPDNYGNAQLNYQRKDWNWNINVIAQDGIDVLQDQNTIAVLNSKIIYRINSQWEISANARNLTDNKYFTPTSFPIGQNQSGDTIQELPARDRQIFISLYYSLND